jgi:hypothetical protein
MDWVTSDARGAVWVYHWCSKIGTRAIAAQRRRLPKVPAVAYSHVQMAYFGQFSSLPKGHEVRFGSLDGVIGRQLVDS